MFYTGWDFFAPTSMNVGALAAEVHHTSAANHTDAAFIIQQPLADDDDVRHRNGVAAEADTSSENEESTASQPDPSPPQIASSSSRAQRRRRHRRLRTFSSSSSGAQRSSSGCVLHLTARPPLSYKEMEQQLQRRAVGGSDCFHVKSNLPILAQTGVLLMECVVRRPATTTTTAANPRTVSKRTSVKADDQAKLPMPALVIGVCQRQLPWCKLPGEANNSIGFYVTQRHVVKHGSDDRDEVMVPYDTHAFNSTSSGGGGGRISEGDAVGCLVDLIQHTLSFTVNTHVVSTHSMDLSYEDGSLFFAIGLARRPQQATDVVVRFYTGSASLQRVITPQRQPAESQATASSPPLPSQAQPRFPLAPYVRKLAIASVRQQQQRGRESGADDDGPDDFISAITGCSPHAFGIARGAAVAPRAVDVSLSSSSPPPFPAFTPPSPEAVRDLRASAVLRDYLASRGMAQTLKTLDAEMDDLAPSHARLYSRVFADDGAGAETQNTSSVATLKDTAEDARNGQGDAWRPRRPPQVGETRAAWQAHADDMAELRRAVLAPPCLSDSVSHVLLTHALWKPSLVLSFARFVDRAAANAAANAAAAPEASQTHGDTTCSLRKRLPTVSSTPPYAKGHHNTNSRESRGGNKARDATQAPMSPYAWFDAAVAPSLLTCSLLTLRQDVRYVVLAHKAVEEMWQRLRTHLQNAKESYAAAARDKRKMDVQGPSTWSSSFAPTMDAEQREVAAFTAFFTALIWDAKHKLPTAVTRSHHVRRGDVSATAERAASPVPLHAKAMEVLAELARQIPNDADAPPSTGAVPQDSVVRAGGARDDMQHHFTALVVAHVASMTEAASERQKRYTATSSSSLSASSFSSALCSPHLEEALLVLYRSSVVPAAAPSRSAQVRLLQTLCSLFTHILSVLRQLAQRTLGTSEETPSSSSSSSSEGTPAGITAAVTSLQLLTTLLDTVEQHFRKLVWRRLAHAIEEVNRQLMERLDTWHAAAVAAAAASRRCNEPISTWASIDYGIAATSSSEEGSQQERGQEAEEVVHTASETATGAGAAGATAGTPPQTESLTASFSSFQAVPTPEDDDDDDVNGGHGRGVSSQNEEEEEENTEKEASRHVEQMSYEALTEGLPSLRLLWRRVAARAALEPSQHLVTDLFVQELRASLALAPRVGWREEGAEDGTRVNKGDSPPAASPSFASSGAALNGESGSVKQPRSVRQCGAAAEGVPLKYEADAADPLQGAALAAQTVWLTEELYLSSVYMKRVLKHFSGGWGIERNKAKQKASRQRV